MPEGFSKMRDFVGVNLTDPASRIADNELAWARNCWPKDLGIIGPRQQQATLGYIISSLLSGGTASASLGDVTAEASLFYFSDKNNTPRVVIWAPFDGTPSVGQFLLNDESLTINEKVIYPPGISGAAANAVFPRLLGTPKRPTALVYNNELFLFMGYGRPGLIFGADDLVKASGQPQFRQLGTTWASFTGATDEQIPFSFGDIYKGIILLGGAPPPYESLVFFCQGIDSTGAPQPAYYSLLTSAKAAGAGFGDGDKLLRVLATPIVGGAIAIEQYALAFKRRSVWLMQGDPPTATDSGTLVVTPVMKREGLIAPHAVCHTPYGMAWCSGRNVWLMAPGTTPRPIGYKVKGFLEKLPQREDERWFMEFHDDVLYLNVPAPGGLVDGQDAVLGSGETLKYLPSQQLWCDLRDPENPRWWGPQDVRCSHMLSLVPPAGVHQLVGITPRRVSTINFTRYLTFQMTEKADNKGRDLGDSGSANAFTGGQVPCSTFQDIKFREMDYGDDNLLKVVDALEVNASWDIGIGTAKGTVFADDAPSSGQFLGDAGKKKQTPSFPGVAEVTLVDNPDTGNFIIEVQDDIDGSGGDYSAQLALLALRTKFARNLSINVSPGWSGGFTTIFGTDMYGNSILELFDTQSVGVSGGVVVGTKYFLTITNVLLGSGGGSGIVADISEGPQAQIQDTTDDPASTGFTLGQNTLGGLNPANLSKTFVPVVFFPANGSRFNCFTFQPRLWSKVVDDVLSTTNADEKRVRRLWVKSVTPRVRPIGRRPGGSFGG